VGQCILEKETTFINYVTYNSDIIISGLGKSIPKSVLVVPLLNNRILIGIIEIESLGDIQQYQINFVERIAETIAATVSTVKTNVRTAQLLGRAKKQAEELEQQEEEMRQNMEEMQATQEEASKREAELESIIEGFNLLMPVLEYDTKGKVIDVNDNYLKIYKSKKSQIVGKKHKADLFMNETEQAKHKEFWNNLANGIVAESLGYIKSGKDDYWLQEKFLPIKNQYGLVHKILCVGIDVTEEKKAESRIKQIQEGIIHTKENLDKNDPINPVIDLNQNLKIIDLTYLKMVYKKDPAKIFNILKLYYDTLPSQIAEVQSLSTTKDYNKLKSRINSLKTKMSYLGLKKVYEQLRAIEKILNDQKNLTEIPAMITGIIRYWELAYGELQQLLKIQRY
jgi:PAS domain S-box-containing protein